MVTFKMKGDFSKVANFLEKARESIKLGKLDKYGRAGVSALSSATPVDTGLTANSWEYEIKQGEGYVSIDFHNMNFNKGVPIAIVLQYGHGTSNGGWVEGRDYINPAIQPIFDQIVQDAWKEVTRI